MQKQPIQTTFRTKRSRPDGKSPMGKRNPSTASLKVVAEEKEFDKKDEEEVQGQQHSRQDDFPGFTRSRVGPDHGLELEVQEIGGGDSADEEQGRSEEGDGRDGEAAQGDEDGGRVSEETD